MKTKLLILLFASCLIFTLSLSLNLSLLLTSHVFAFVAAPTEDVKNTRHNLSSSGPADRNVFTTQTTEICVFCHTPHGANTDAVSFGAPIWNRKLSEASYTMYDQVWSKSFEGTLNTGQPTGFSRLCLSCHDGTIALGRVINPSGSGGFVPITTGGDPGTFSFSMNTAPTQTMPAGAGEFTGDTRLLGTELRNDHAISFEFTTTSTSFIRDGELVDPGAGINIALQGSLTRPDADPNLSPTKRHVGTDPNVADSVQCTSCHNPHQVDYPKFLRANRIQLDQGAPYSDSTKKISSGCPPSCNPPLDESGFSGTPATPPEGAIICLFCHDKPGVPYGGVSLSTHFTDPTKINLTSTVSKPLTTDLFGTTAQPLSSVINQTPATVTVAQRACLACHDPHTEQGSIRLLRQGADNSVNPPDVAIEQTCYMCHSPTGRSFNAIDTGDCPDPATPGSPGNAQGTRPEDCPPDVLTQFQKDAGTTGEADDPAFSVPEFGLTASTTTGSAMNLRLGLGHEPVFTNLPREGVQLGDENPQGSSASTFGGPFNWPIAENKRDPENAPLVNDTRHIECVDCHNMHRVDRTNRFRGMPGITIGTGAFGTPLDTSGGSTLLVAQTLNSKDVTREPYIFEVCLRCHGNSFNLHVKEQRVTTAGTGLIVQLRGNNPVMNFTYTGSETSSTLGGGSNKRKEFDPNAKPYYDANPATVGSTGQARLNNAAECGTTTPPGPNCNNGLPGSNTSFHPVAAPGRNQSGVLNNCGTFTVVGTEGRCSGGGQLLGQLSRKNTIHCTDCHNSDLFGTYDVGNSQPPDFNSNLPVSIPDFPGPISFDYTRGDPYRRLSGSAVFSWITDGIYEGDLGASGQNPIPTTSGTIASLNDPNTPQGPHGSQWKRILRSNYATQLATDFDNEPGGGYNSRNFALCFNCHNEAAFITEDWNTASDRLTNFYRGGTGNLHWLHLAGEANARCHECHYNVHSNIESGNTLYVNIPGLEPNNPGHASSTHLINFAPEVGVNDYNNPVWGNGSNVNPGAEADKHGGPGCNLKCHGFSMKHNYDTHSVQAGGKCIVVGTDDCQR